MIVLDANILIAHFEAGHIFAAAAAEIMDTEAELVIHPLTFSECMVGAIKSQVENELRQAIERIGIAIWNPDSYHWLRIARLRAQSGLKLPDCCVLDAAKAQRATLATFDEALADSARAAGVHVQSFAS